MPTTTQGEIQDEPDHASDPTGDGTRDEPRSEPHDRELPGHQNTALTEHDGGRLEDSGRKPPESDGSVFTGIRAEYSYSGPTPPVGDIERWEQVLPGAADRILSMAERAQAHQETTERHQVFAEGRSFQTATFAVSFFPWSLAAAAIVLAIFDQALVAAVAGFTSVISGFGPNVINAVRPRRRPKQG